MKKLTLLPLCFAFALACLPGAASAADGAQDAYGNIASIEQQLFAKQAELNALNAEPRPDVARAQGLFREIGELEGRLFAARAELGVTGAGFQHPCEFGQGCYGNNGYYGHRYGMRGGYRGNRGGYMMGGGYQGGGRGNRGGGGGRGWGRGCGRW